MKPPKLPEQPKQNHRNHRNNPNETNETAGTETKLPELQLKDVTYRLHILFGAIILTYLPHDLCIVNREYLVYRKPDGTVHITIGPYCLPWGLVIISFLRWPGEFFSFCRAELVPWRGYLIYRCDISQLSSALV